MILVLKIILTFLPPLLAIGFVVYLMISVKKGKKRSKERMEQFDAELKQMVAIAIKEGKERVEQAVAESGERINLLSLENAKLMEENEAMRDKLHVLGFKEPYI